MGDLGLPGGVRMTNASAQKALWEVRKAGLNIMMSMKGDGKPVSFIEDCAVPLDHLADYVDRLTQVFAKHGTRGAWYAHASVGTLHVRPILDMRQGGPNGGATKMRAIAEEASAMVREYKGAYSGEHGDGLVRDRMGRLAVRRAADARIRGGEAALRIPAGLMNPGKIVRGTKMDDARLFRYPPGYQPMRLDTALDWSAWNVNADPVADTLTAPGTGGDPAQGFAKAVEMCNNNGHCRKFDAGTMCPSFRVTRDEEHGTRGRANTLRLALSGQLGPDFASEEVRAALDLCVSCKGCKRDCPTGVDMAKMKIEFAWHWQKKYGLSLKDKIVAHLPRWAPWAARFPLARQFARHAAGCGPALGKVRRLFSAADTAALAQRYVSDEHSRTSDCRWCRGGRAAGRYVQQLPRARERARCAARIEGRGLSGSGGARVAHR